jgi:hypothetical protein
MINEKMAKEIGDALDKEFTGTSKLRPANGDNGVKLVTVSNDIEALKRKLDAIARGINILRDQL